MKNAHIRFLVVLAILSLLGIVGSQVFWLNRAIAQQDRVFNYNVQVALRNVVESLCEANGKDFPSVNPIEQVSGNYFIVRTNDKIDLKNLEYLISAEIKKRAISQDFEYGVYDCASNEMVYAEDVPLAKSSNKQPMPILENDEYYFGIYFPEKSKNLYASFDLWKFTAAITLVVIVFFGYALFVILRQKRLSEVQRNFINNVSHELKTPLSTLSLASTTLMTCEKTKNNKYLKIIDKEVDRLQKNVEHILHAAFTNHRIMVKKVPLNLFAYLAQMKERMEEIHASKKIIWSLDGSAEKIIATDPKLLEKIIQNILDNAVKYGGRSIKISATQDSRFSTITVSDDGMGIAKAHQSKIFKKFYRVPEVHNQHNQKGFGLGLQIVKNSVDRLGGSIKCLSEESKGSTFITRIPNG